MFNLTLQERKVILFLISMVLSGLGIKFAVKVNSPIVRLIQADDRIAKIDINKAGLEDLLGIPGVTPKLANSIAAYRAQKGRFGDIEELKEIKGIGDYRYGRLKELFYVE